ncbi:MAG: hypothetical protein KKD38_07775 [Candidatus Delongbacteria bacterium]|nr:hypothetical protein [Candidatus Delongbacteria bacterium]MCG2761164.1 hypothetical protein [Candidatus Delongbacteria bacterium]
MEESIYSQAYSGMKLAKLGTAQYIEIALVLLIFLFITGYILVSLKEKRDKKKERMIKVYIECKE